MPELTDEEWRALAVMLTNKNEMLPLVGSERSAWRKIVKEVGYGCE